ncbi:hypothetical protein ACHAWU_001698 [Discostella pseudostelligera]|uniref:Fatty acid hydroxylase domain-containing protein n=1 Tax=Discostella pseudostelligera TaxID=259834 RepID=A0ABD3M8A2_9STRA
MIFGRFSPHIAEVILFAVPGPYFVAYAIVVALPPYLLEWEFFEQYKISKDPWPWRLDDEGVDDDEDEGRRATSSISTRQKQKEFRKLSFISLCIDVASVFFYFPLCIYIKTLLLPHHTFSMSFSLDDWPTMYQSAILVPAMAIFHELLFYISHRIMHAYPILYKYHKVHHEYKQNTVLAAQYFHIVDFVLTISGPIVVTTILFRPHSFTQFQVGLWIFTANLDDHLGYAFPWSAVRSGTDAHEFHHSVNMGCYGSKLSLWDWVFQTDGAYERWRMKRSEQSISNKSRIAQRTQ